MVFFPVPLDNSQASPVVFQRVGLPAQSVKAIMLVNCWVSALTIFVGEILWLYHGYTMLNLTRPFVVYILDSYLVISNHPFATLRLR